MKTIKLTKDKETIVDDKDYIFLSQWSWQYDLRSGYACRTKYVKSVNGREISKRVLMHSLIMDTPNGLVTDHINGDKLNNCQYNLRVCTQSQNCMNVAKKKNNTSGYPGVSLFKRVNKWTAYIMVNRRKIHLGYFNTREEAWERRKHAMEQYFGEFANYNL